MSSAVQFYGADSAVKAFEYKKIASWALFQGRALLHKHEGTDMNEAAKDLQEFLEMLGDATTAVYTLKVYDGNQKIKENTPCDGSFNFRLIEESERQQRQAVYAGSSKAVLERLQAIEEKLSAEETEDEDEDQGGINGIIKGIIEDPEKLLRLIQVGKTILGIGEAPKVIPMQKVSGIEDQSLQAAIATLKKNDPQITEHLTKLAAISEKDPETFKYLLSILDKM